MSIERPISTIRKAVRGVAEENALGGLYDTPEKKDFDEAINMFRFLKNSDPEKFELVVKIGAEGKELKDAMGIEKYKAFIDTWEELCKRDIAKIKLASNQIEKGEMSSDAKQRGVYKLNENFYNQKSDEMKQDPRLISAFKGKEDLFKHAIEFTSSTAIKMFELEQRQQQLGFIREKEQQGLYAKILKYIRGLK